MLIAHRNGTIDKQNEVAPSVGPADGVVVVAPKVRALNKTGGKGAMDKTSPRLYMEKSIEIMRASIHERRADSKPTPYVGAVIVLPDGRVDTAYRGELREGDHAEYTLIERKHRSDNLAGSTLYATLEPCAPGARHFPKLGCAERIVNARIKKVYIGIEDPDPKVAGKGIKYLLDCGIEVSMYPRELQSQIEEVNQQFLSAALDRARRIDESAEGNQLSTKIEGVADNVQLEDLSVSLLHKFAYSAGLAIENQIQFYRQLSQIGILESVDGKYRPTGIGYLLFGTNPQLKYQQACINCVFRRVGYKEDIYKISGPLIEQPEQLFKWYAVRMTGQTDRSKPQRHTVYDYPYEVINELVKNAILHRDYNIGGAPIYFEISDEEITIKSPGLPLAPITLEAIQRFNAPSLSRNPKIMFVFEAMKLAEQRGLGFDTVRRLRAEYDLPLPIVKYENPYIVFTLPRSCKSSILSLYTEPEQAVLETLRMNGTLQRWQIEERCGFTKKKVNRILYSLIQKGVVITLEKGRNARYVLRDSLSGHDSVPSVPKEDQWTGSDQYSGRYSGQSVQNEVSCTELEQDSGHSSGQ